MTVNLTSTERVARVILGAGLIAFATLSFIDSQVFADRAFSVAFAILGLDTLVTGAIGFSPLYYWLGCRSLALS